MKPSNYTKTSSHSDFIYKYSKSVKEFIRILNEVYKLIDENASCKLKFLEFEKPMYRFEGSGVYERKKLIGVVDCLYHKEKTIYDETKHTYTTTTQIFISEFKPDCSDISQAIRQLKLYGDGNNCKLIFVTYKDELDEKSKEILSVSGIMWDTIEK